MLLKQKSYRNKKYLQAAKGQNCTLRFPGCNNNPETTVAAHSPFKEHGGGMGLKAPDDKIAFACSYCHDVLDGRVPSRLGKAFKKTVFNRGNSFTLMIIEDMGLEK